MLTKEELDELWLKVQKEDDAKNYGFDSAQLLEKFYIISEIQLGLLGTLLRQTYQGRVTDTISVLWGVSTSTSLVSKLVNDGDLNYINEMYILSRSVIERVITFLYLQVCSEEVYQSYHDYGVQKYYRKRMEKIEVENGNQRVEIKQSLNISDDLLKEIKPKIDKFTSKKGKEITRWDAKSIEKKLEEVKVDGRYKTGVIELALKVTYDKASEIVHGTSYGNSYQYSHFGKHLKYGKIEMEGIQKEARSEIMMLFFQLVLVVNFISETLAKELDDKDMIESVTKIQKIASQMMKLSLGKN